MGSYASKLLYHGEENQKESIETQVIKEDNEVCTPIWPDRKLVTDPRSATAGILRTPIEVNSTPIGITKRVLDAIPKYLQKKQYLETNMDVVMPPLTPKKHFVVKSTNNVKFPEIDETPNINVIKTQNKITSIERERFKILGLDPRSPAADFDRTPILMPRSLALLKARSQENLSRRGSYEADVYNPKNLYQEFHPSLDISEAQLLPDIAIEGLKKIYCKNQNELHSTPQFISDSSISISEEEVTVIKNLNSKNGEDKSLISDKLTFHTNKNRNIHKQDNCKDIEQDLKAIHTKDNTIKIWNDTLSLEENTLGKIEEKEKLQKEVPKEDITFNKYIENISISKIKMGNIQKKEDIEKEKRKILKTDIKPKSDEKKMFSSNKYNEILENRTPLGNRSNNDQIQGITKLPQLLKNNTIIKKQQENTPPLHEKYIAKTRNGTQWDPNSTIVI